MLLTYTDVTFSRTGEIRADYLFLNGEMMLNVIRIVMQKPVTACKLIDTYTRKENFKFKIRKIMHGKIRNVAYVLTEYGKLTLLQP